jgi:hypothetical protein
MGKPRPDRLPFPSPAVAWSDRSGDRLLVIQPSDDTNRLGVLAGNTVVLTGSPLLPSQPQGYTELQNALQGANGGAPPFLRWLLPVTNHAAGSSGAGAGGRDFSRPQRGQESLLTGSAGDYRPGL